MDKIRESLITIYIKRAYWVVNCIHNKAFFNQAGKTYVTPDREDEVVAMLTEQDPVEVALLRITRELIERAEKEQPEKKLNITKLNKNKETVEPIPEQVQKNEEGKKHQQIIEVTRSQEDLQKSMQKRKLGNEESNEEKVQETAIILQQEVSIRVSQENTSQTSTKSMIRRNEAEDQVKDIEQEDIEMNGKESRQGSAIEEKERQKRRKQETEEEIDIVGMPIEESIWAPNKRECNQNSSLLANIPAYNVPGSTEEERIKFIEWSLKNNEHVKEVREVFKRGNL